MLILLEKVKGLKSMSEYISSAVFQVAGARY
jgi:hypothetical protein